MALVLKADHFRKVSKAKYSRRVDFFRFAFKDVARCGRHFAFVPGKKLVHRSKNKRNFDPSCGAPNAAVNLAAQRPEVDRFGQKRLRAILERLTLGVRIAVGSRNIRANGLYLGRSSKPLIPGMLMSDRIKMREWIASIGNL